MMDRRRGLLNQDRLPVEYQEVEYIQSHSAEYIDLLLKGTEKTKVEIIFQPVGNRNFAPFGARESVSANCFAIWASSTSVGSPLRIGFDSTAGYTGPSTTNDEYHIIYSADGVYVNGVFVKQWDFYSPFETPKNLIIFGYYNNKRAEFSSTKIKRCILYENNIKTRHLIPCYSIYNNEIGMYDLVNGVFYTNQGTGTFEKGPDVN